MTCLLLALALLQPARPDAAALSEQATRLSQAKQYAEAERLWLKALAIDSRFFPAAFNLGFQHFSRHEWAKAETYLRKAATLEPNDFNSRYLLGLAMVNQDRREAGLREWQEALRINPRHTKLMLVMAVEYGKGHYFREAAAVARRAVELNPADQNAYFVALKACQDAQDPAGLDLAKVAAERFPNSARANFEYGFHLQRAGLPEQALPYLRKAMSLDTSYEEPFFFHGEILAREDKHEEAVQSLRKALAIRPDYVPASMVLAKSLMTLERFDEARQELARIIAASPDHPQPHLLLSQIYYRLGDEERARAEKSISMKLRRANPSLMEAPQAVPFPKEPQSR